MGRVVSGAKGLGKELQMLEAEIRLACPHVEGDVMVVYAAREQILEDGSWKVSKLQMSLLISGDGERKESSMGPGGLPGTKKAQSRAQEQVWAEVAWRMSVSVTGFCPSLCGPVWAS